MLIHDIFEGRDAPLYHGTSIFNAVHILETNTFRDKTFHSLKTGIREDSDMISGVSLSRSFQAAEVFGGIVFILDQRKLAQKYKIIPVDFWEHMKYSDRPKVYAEAEEFIRGSITNANAYILGIRLNSWNFQMFKQNHPHSHTGDILFNHKLLKII